MTDFAHTHSIVRDIREERFRQIFEEGWSTAHDDQHSQGDLAQAAGCYAFEAASAALMGRGDCPVAGWAPEAWPWDPGWWKPGAKRRNLVKAAALIIAEIERLDRMGDAS